jgi:truncated hemoglobin YjbI
MEAAGRAHEPSTETDRQEKALAGEGTPIKYTGEDLRDAHRDLRITPGVFDEVVAELGKAFDHFKVPQREKAEALAAFNGQKVEVTAGAKVEAKPLSAAATSCAWVWA